MEGGRKRKPKLGQMQDNNADFTDFSCSYKLSLVTAEHWILIKELWELIYI